MTSQRTKTQQQGDQTKQQILDAAARLMAEHGYAGTSVSLLREASGQNASSIYHHFGSKDGVLAAVMERGAARFFEALPRWEDTSGEPEERLAMLLRRAADAFEEHPEFLRLFLILALQSEQGGDVAREIVGRVRSEAVAAYEEALFQMLAARHDRKVARRVARKLSVFAIAQFDGLFVAKELNPSLRLRPQFAQLHTAVLALVAAELPG